MTAFNVWASRARQIGNGRNPPDRDPRIGRGNGRCGATAHAQPITAGWLIRAGNGRSSREVDRLIFVPRCPRTDRARSCGARRRLRAGARTAECNQQRGLTLPTRTTLMVPHRRGLNVLEGEPQADPDRAPTRTRVPQGQPPSRGGTAARCRRQVARRGGGFDPPGTPRVAPGVPANSVAKAFNRAYVGQRQQRHRLGRRQRHDRRREFRPYRHPDRRQRPGRA